MDRYRDQTYEVVSKEEKYVWSVVGAYIDGIPAINEPGARWTREARSKGLLLMGAPGAGKTLLGHEVLEVASERGHSVRVVDFFDYVNWHRMLIGTDIQGEERAALFDEVQDIESERVHYMLVDDVGKEYVGSTNYAPLLFHQLMRHRGNALLPTVVTTNLSAQELAKVYGNPVWSHLNEVCHIVEMKQEHRF
jgi:DNA replication protein DnaC